MAIQFFESYERGDNLQAVSTTNATNQTSPTPPQGSRVMGITTAGHQVYTFTSGATKIAHFWFQYTTIVASKMLEFRNGSTALGSIRKNSSNQLELYNGASTLLGNSGNALMSINTWYHIQVKIVISASAGILEVKKDNVIVASYTGLNTGTTDVDRIAILCDSNTNYFKDVVVDSENYLGVTRVKSFLPTGAGNYTAFTGTYTDVDEVPKDDDTTVLSSILTGDKESVTFSAHGLSSTSAVKAVVLNAVAKGASGEQIKIGYRVSSSDYMSSAQNLATSYALHSRIDELNPVDNLGYDLSDLVPEAVVESVIP